jgi:putative tricarboxylic transport membrane protein
MGPKNLSEPQVQYWEEALRRLADSDEWKRELEANTWHNQFLRSADARKFLERETTEVRSFLVDLGMAK